MTTDPIPATNRRGRKGLLIAGTGLVVVAGIAAALLLIPQPAASTDKDLPEVEVETAAVTRGDLVERVRVKGTLAFDGARDLGTSLGGTITHLPDAGTLVDRGGELFRVDDKPVLLLLGTLPMWRGFELGMDDGPDVLQLEQNLAALGYFKREPNKEFAESTENAIAEWQKALGLEKTGALEPGRIVFSEAVVRIAAPKATVGDQAGPAVVAVSGTEKRVNGFVAPNLKEVAAVGSKVTVDLPDGTDAPGTVVAVGAPVEKDDGQGGKSLKLPVTVSLDEPTLAEAFSDVSVSMTLSLTRSEDGLIVPVLALLAQPGGGFAVEVLAADSGQSGGGYTIVPVELGSFADGMVEIVSGDLDEGAKVVVGQ